MVARVAKIRFDRPPPHWGTSGMGEDCSLHQISPYIGKLKPKIARDLVSAYTNPGEWIVDPFCGSGTIPLEAKLLGRNVVAVDNSPYACLLTRAKLNAPNSLRRALDRLDRVVEAAARRPQPDLASIPDWVKVFFHPETLGEILSVVDECVASREQFILAALLGILHHQRPGFLSFPSSHLVPYLREKRFPREAFPELYEARAVRPRLEAKIRRSYKIQCEGVSSVSSQVLQTDIDALKLRRQVDAIVTSPPYMNALDYRRDNRLRLWFLDRTTTNYSPEPTDRRAGLRRMVENLVGTAEANLRPGGNLVLVIGESVVRKRTVSHPSETFVEALLATNSFALSEAIKDKIPDIRRSRKDGQATKTEHILVFRRLKPKGRRSRLQ